MKIIDKKRSDIDLYFIYSENQKSHYKKFTPEILTQEKIQDYLGVYYSDVLDSFYMIKSRNNDLLVKFPTTKISELFFIDKDIFMFNYEVVEFIRNEQQKINGFYLYNFAKLRNNDTEKGIFFKKINFEGKN